MGKENPKWLQNFVQYGSASVTDEIGITVCRNNPIEVGYK